MEDVAKASALLRENALKVHYHWMPGLPGSTPEEDLRLSKMLFEDPRFRPDGLKIYPTMVVQGTELEKWYQEKLYQPYDNETMLDLIANIKSQVPKYVRISRVLRDIPAKFIVGGLRDSMRDPMRQRMEQMGLQCQCIRCREYGFRMRDKQPVGEPQLTSVSTTRLPAAGRFSFPLKTTGRPFSAFSGLRIQEKPVANMGEVTGRNVALIRELHVFGPELPLNQRLETAAQHRGFGKALLKEAERIAREEFERERIAVLSGVGAREYYRAEGYTLEGNYMVKNIGITFIS